MKHIISIVAALCGLASFAAASNYTLVKGENSIAGCGQVVAIEAVTADESPTVTLSELRQVTEYTNAYKRVVSNHDVFPVTYTNFDGNAAISTNVFDRFDGSAFATNVSWIGSIVTNTTPWKTNWIVKTTRIIEAGSPFVAQVTNTVANGRAPKVTTVITNELASVSVSNHYSKTLPENTFFTGGRLFVSGCKDEDQIVILFK